MLIYRAFNFILTLFVFTKVKLMKI